MPRLAARAAALLLLLGLPAAAQESAWEIGGRAAGRFLATHYPADSLFRALTGESSGDLTFDGRLVTAGRVKRWDLEADLQLAALYGDRVEYSREFPDDLQLLFGRLPTDDGRLMDLTRVFHDEGRSAGLVRLDRLSVGYTGEKGVVRLGRQAITWGNGMLYTPMDIFNPFDPAAVDREFKTGDDMLYGQYLRGNGDDVQGVLVLRRDRLTGAVESEEASLAGKYHGMAGAGEFDALLAVHYGDELAGGGGNLGLGGAVWRGDLVVTRTEDETVASAVTSLSYSWTWGGKNWSGVLEYFHSGFGQGASDYAPDSLAGNPELLERIARGELFTLGRHYLAASAMIEITPLFLLTPNLFTNLADPSALLQVVTQNDLMEDLVLLGALNVPVGPPGSEFGGIESGIPGLYLSSGPSVFVQLNWYF
jgi:hypothetical protein